MPEDRNTPRNVQIPTEAFIRLGQYFLLDNHSEGLERQIKQDITIKLDALLKHRLYTDYKTALTPEEKEKARQEYLNKVGILDSFRWDTNYEQNR